MLGKAKTKTPFLYLLLVLGLLAGCAGLLTEQADAPDAVGGAPISQSAPPLRASGVIQARQVSLASEIGGRVAQLLVEEGQAVSAGQAVVQLDPALIDAEIAIAKAVRHLAEAGLQQARAGARPGQIAIAEAELRQAQAAHAAARQAVTDTATLLATPQDLDLQIAVLRAQIETAQAQASQAIAQKDAIEVAKGVVDEAWERYGGGGRHRFTVADGKVEDLVEDVLPDPIAGQLPDNWVGDLPSLGDRTISYGDYELILRDGSYTLSVFRDIDFPLNATLLPNQWWQAWIGVNAATAQMDALEAKLATLIAQRAEPQSLQAQHDEAVALTSQLAAQVAMAETQVAALRIGLTPEELAVIEAQVSQAQAGLDALQRKRDMLSLASPISGTVISFLAREGEVAAQGAPIAKIADLSDLTLTVYVPETRLAQLSLDQQVVVAVDSHPDRTFLGAVVHIADRAEFTPRNVATVEERQNLVFAVGIRLTNHEGALKPGMPADVRFTAGEVNEP